MNDRKKIFELFEQNREIMEDRINSGIERNRKGYADIVVKDADGKPVSNAKVSVKQKSHAFRYGANLFMLDELETPEKNEAYKKYFAELFNMATLPFYWDSLEPEAGKPRYAKDSEKIYRRPATDLCIEFCEANGIEPREHALAYAAFFPKWLHNATLQEVKQALEKRYQEISERYAKKIPTIEVTNEMFWDTDRSLWDGKNKAIYEEDDYIEFCFKLAEKYFPGNKLCINEWSEFWNEHGRCTDSYYAYIKNAISNGARIDAVGMQYHMFFKKEEEYESTRKFYDPIHLYKIMDRYAKLGKPIEITEVTIPAYSENPEDEAVQAELIELLYSIWFSHENVEQIIYWNLVDGYAAFAEQGDMTAGENYYYGGLLRFDLTPKPAYYTIKNLFEKKWHTETVISTNQDGKARFKGFYGKYDIEIESGDKKIVTEIDFVKGNPDSIQLVL